MIYTCAAEVRDRSESVAVNREERRRGRAAAFVCGVAPKRFAVWRARERDSRIKVCNIDVVSSLEFLHEHQLRSCRNEFKGHTISIDSEIRQLAPKPALFGSIKLPVWEFRAPRLIHRQQEMCLPAKSRNSFRNNLLPRLRRWAERSETSTREIRCIFK